MERKLTAILSADVKGYSRLMGEDEEATIRTLTVYREVMTALMQHRGRVVDSPGDNLLAEFASAVDAVQGAVAIQHELQSRNIELPHERKMQYRIGINVGDVIVEGERLYGDGVNIAARLEGLAEPGGICISGTVYDQVENKLALSYTYVGEQEVKNIAKPVRVYRIGVAVPSPLGGFASKVGLLHKMLGSRSMYSATGSSLFDFLGKAPLGGEGQGEGDIQDSANQKAKGKNQKAKVGEAKLHRLLRWMAVGLVLVAISVIATRYWSFLAPSTQHLAPNPQHLVPDTQSPTPSAQALPLPDKPSIAVLPFTNMSGDPGQDYFSDGMTDDLITALSKLSGLLVIARNSTFVYKGQAVKVSEVSRDLRVRYVLEGSVRKADNRVCINAQLVDAATAQHIWAEQYDREYKEVFALQDEIREKIVFALKVKLTPEEQDRLRSVPTTNLEAYEALLRGLEYYFRVTKEGNLQARRLFERAIELDGQYASAYAMLSHTYRLDGIFHWNPEPRNLEQALALAQRAVALDDSLPIVHAALSLVYIDRNQPEQAQAEMERAIALDPNSADGYAELGKILHVAGRPTEGLAKLEQALRLNPHPPFYYFFYLYGRHTKIWIRRGHSLFVCHCRLVRQCKWLHG